MKTVPTHILQTAIQEDPDLTRRERYAASELIRKMDKNRDSKIDEDELDDASPSRLKRLFFGSTVYQSVVRAFDSMPPPNRKWF